MSTLSVPVGPRDHIQGDANAPVTLVEYGDFQCPSCGAAHPVVKQLQQEFGDRLRFVFRHFPLPQHDFAEFAAETAEFAATEGQFWEMHDALFENQDQMDDDLFPKLAENLELDSAALTKALDKGKFEDRVAEDIEGGENSGVQGTPTFYINGKFEDRVAEDIEGGENSGVQGTPTFYINGKMHTGSIQYEALVAAIKAEGGR